MSDPTGAGAPTGEHPHDRTEPVPEHDRTEPVPEHDRTEPVPEHDRTEPVPESQPTAATWTMPADLEGRYAFVENIRATDEAIVVRARALEPDGFPPDVVIKVYHQTDPDYELETLRDLTSAASRSVVRVVEAGGDRRHPFEVMEHLPGGTLADVLAPREPLDTDTVRRLVTQLTEGLRVIHSRPVDAIHRDLKPSNILIRGRTPLDVAIGDFGRLARADRLRKLISTSGARPPALVGTPRYFSPQHMRGARLPAADWYSLGLIVHEALFGRHPFDDSRGHFTETSALDVLEGGAPIPLLRHADPQWNELLEGLTRFSPGERWRAAEVEAWLAGRSASPPPRTPPTVHPGDSFPFDEDTYRSTRDLAAAMLNNHRAGERLATDIARLTELSRWLRQGGNGAIADRVLDLAAQFEQDDLSAARRLVAIARALDPAVEPVFHGKDNKSVPGRIDSARLGALASTVLDPERDSSRELATLRDLYASDALREYAQIEGQDARLALVPDAWAANYALVAETRDAAHNVEVTRHLQDRDGMLFALSLHLSLVGERERDRIRRRALPALGDDSALGQEWFAVLARRGLNEFTDNEDPRGGQVAAISATLAGILREAARAAELGIVRRRAAEEPDFPETPGGRREDVDYSEIADPPSLVGQHATLPRPALPRYDPSWIFSATGRVSLLTLLFRGITLLGAALVTFGVIRLVWLDSATQVDPTLPQRLLAAPEGPAAWWLTVYTTWTSVPVLAALDPLSAAGAWVPVVGGVATLGASWLARLSIRPPVTRFKDVAPSPGRHWAIAAAVGLSIGVLTLWAPWTILLAAPLLVILALTRTL